MVTGYVVLVLAVACERLVELVVAKRHASWLLARGGLERGASHYPLMVAMHVAFLAGCLLEPALLGRPFVPPLAGAMTAVVLASEALRWWAVVTLGVRWTTRVIVLPGVPRVMRGPYRYFPHPNYVAVVAEGIALPLVHSAWITAALFTAVNAVVLRERIRTEDAALAQAEP